MKRSILDDFFGDAGKCAKCGKECDADRELCPACLEKAMKKPSEKVDVRDNSEDEMEDQ